MSSRDRRGPCRLGEHHRVDLVTFVDPPGQRPSGHDVSVVGMRGHDEDASRRHLCGGWNVGQTVARPREGTHEDRSTYEWRGEADDIAESAHHEGADDHSSVG